MLASTLLLELGAPCQIGVRSDRRTLTFAAPRLSLHRGRPSPRRHRAAARAVSGVGPRCPGHTADGRTRMWRFPAFDGPQPPRPGTPVGLVSLLVALPVSAWVILGSCKGSAYLGGQP